MQNKSHNIIYLGCSSFPYGLAEVQKIILVSKALILENASVTVICYRGLAERNKFPDLQKSGYFQGIKYLYSSGNPFRENSFIKRNYHKLFVRFREFSSLVRINKEQKIDAAIVSSLSIWSVILYKIFSKLLNFKLILNLVELNTAIAKEQKGRLNLNDLLFDKYAIYLCDGVFPISEYLAEEVRRKAPGKKSLKIPVLVDMERFTGINAEAENKYFLFCGSVLYIEVINFIIRSFELLDNNDVFLYLVINGKKNYFDEVLKAISESRKNSLIKIFSSVSDFELSVLYKNACALLIPLRPGLQDIARFPHKTGEYLASGNPIVSTNIGEIKYYLKDNENAFLASSYNEIEYAKKMNEVVESPNLRKDVGENGRITASKFFDYRNYGKRILEFIDTI